MALWYRLAELPVDVEDFGTEQRRVDVSTDFSRVTTTASFRGRGEEGVGEDVTYTADDHGWFPSVEALGATTLGAASAALDGVELFHEPPGMEASRHYRRWALDSALLDLA